MEKYKLKKSKESSGFSKEVEAFRYNGNFNCQDVPDWFAKAIQDKAVTFYRNVDGKDELFISKYGVVVRPGYYIVRKLSGNIAACSTEMFYEHYDITER